MWWQELEKLQGKQLEERMEEELLAAQNAVNAARQWREDGSFQTVTDPALAALRATVATAHDNAVDEPIVEAGARDAEAASMEIELEAELSRWVPVPKASKDDLPGMDGLAGVVERA